MPEQTTTYTAVALWEHLFGDLEGHLVTLTGRQSRHKNDLVDTEQRSWVYPDEAEDAAAYLMAQSDQHRDCYFGVHLFNREGTRKAEDTLSEITALWADGDGARVPENWPQPTAVVESSPGRHHYYWRLSRPVSPEEARQLNKRIAYGMGADKGKWGLGTVLRPPGTRNYKREHPTDVVGDSHE